MAQRRLFDDTPLFTEAPPARAWSTPASVLVACSVCAESTPLPPGAFAVPLCLPCRSNPYATLERIERAILAIEERRAAAWQPLQPRLQALTEKEFERYCAIWVARGLAADDAVRAAVERRVMATRREPGGLTRLLDLEPGAIETIETTYRETEPVLKALRSAQYDVLSLKGARGWQIPDDITARRAALSGMRPAVLERV